MQTRWPRFFSCEKENVTQCAGQMFSDPSQLWWYRLRLRLRNHSQDINSLCEVTCFCYPSIPTWIHIDHTSPAPARETTSSLHRHEGLRDFALKLSLDVQIRPVLDEMCRSGCFASSRITHGEDNAGMKKGGRIMSERAGKNGKKRETLKQPPQAISL